MKGDITIRSCLEHSHSEGTTWFKSSEMNLMLSLLLSDGRYQGQCFVVSFLLAQKVSIAFQAYVEYTNLIENCVVESQIDVKLLKQRAQAEAKYNNFKNCILKTVVKNNLGISHCKIIVSPYSLGETHWTVTFVFNAAQSLEITQMNSLSTNTSPRVCFYRYNPYEPNGQSKVDLAQGIKWFLNLCASFEEHRKHFEEEQPLTWIQPFGAEK